jgi:hypothetical protein
MDFLCEMAEEGEWAHGMKMQGEVKAVWWIKNRSDDV